MHVAVAIPHSLYLYLLLQRIMFISCLVVFHLQYLFLRKEKKKNDSAQKKKNGIVLVI